MLRPTVADHSESEPVDTPSRADGLGHRIAREWHLWLEFAPEAVGSVAFLALLWLFVVAVDATSLLVGLSGTLLWLVAAGAWVVLGRRPRAGKR